MNENLLSFIVGILWAINPATAFGAAVGTIILINTINEDYKDKKYVYGFLSGFAGYGCALPFLETGYEFIISMVASSVAIYVIIAMQRMIDTNTNLPLWIMDIIEAFKEIVSIIRGGKR